MKKKIALLLAVIMTLSLMPMTVFAGSTNYLEKGTLSLKKDTDYGTKIPNALVLEMKEKTPNYDQKIRIQLTNAEFSNVAPFGGDEADDGTPIPAGQFIEPGKSWDGTNFARFDLWANSIVVTDDTNGVTSGTAITAAGIKLELDGSSDDTATITIPKTFIYTKDTTFSIPLPIKTDDIADADITVAIISNNSQVTPSTHLVSKTTASATNTSVKEIKAGREILSLANVVVQEKLVGSLKNLKAQSAAYPASAGYDAGYTAFELVAPSGYEFVGTTGVLVNGTGEWNGLTGTAQIKTGGNDNSSMLFALNGLGITATATGLSTILPEAIVIEGLQIEPTDDDNIPFGTTLQLTIYKYAGSQLAGHVYAPLDGLSEQSFDAVKPVDWTVEVTAATAKDVVTGRFDTRADANEQVAAKFTMKELVTSAWLSERTTDFTLPEGVSVRGIKFDTWKNMRQTVPTTVFAPTTAAGLAKDKWVIYPQLASADSGVITIDQNTVSIKGVNVVADKKAEIGLILYLSISPEFKGDKVTLSTQGTAINKEEVADVVIANVIQPITVSAKVTDVQIGFQKYAVGDITIKENKAGAILRNANLPAGYPADPGLVLTIKDYISTTNEEIVLVPVKESQVTVDGDLKVTLKKNTSGMIAFDVDRLSTKASTITIKGVEIKINRTVPYGVYDLVVAGQSVFANKADADSNPKVINSLFDAYGYSIPYINVATEGMNSPLKANVKIAKDSDIVIVDGIQQQMAYPTYFDVSQSSFLVPARFISHIFGVEENNIFWNDTTKTVSIITANRTIQFTANSNIMVVGANGAPSNVTMTAKAILHPVTERLYVPFRAIGDAFGVPVSYDEATQMAEYNQAK